jgi:histidinol-phosphate aminotransferase
MILYLENTRKAMSEFTYQNCLRKPILSELLQRPFAEERRSVSKLWLDKNESIDPQLQEISTKILADIDAKSLSVYPDCYELYKKLAAQENVKPENLLLTAGSDGAIRTVFEACINEGDTVIHPEPTFAMYSVYCKMFGAREVLLTYNKGAPEPELPFQCFIDLIRNERPKLVCLANPDSPTGTVYSEQQIRTLIEEAQQQNALVLIDEAYFPFYEHSVLPLIDIYPNLLVARTFAKAWGAAGMRIGFLATNEKLSAYMHKVKPMYEVNTVALRFMEGMLNHTDEITKSVARLMKGKDYFINEMQLLGYIVISTHANFLHVNFGTNKQKIHDALENKVLYRVGFDQECLKGFSRFTISTREVLEDVVSLIKTSVGK